MSSSAPLHVVRRTFLINPRFQGGVALGFAAVAVAAGAAFAWFFGRSASGALRAASFQAHYQFHTVYDLLGDSLVRHLAALLAVSAAAGVALFVLAVRRVRNGIAVLVDGFRRSAEGDLSTPMHEARLPEIADIGTRCDAIRSRMLLRIGEIREEADALRKERLPPEVFRARWDALKARIGGLAP